MLGRERRFRDTPLVEHEAEQAGLNRGAGNPLGEDARTGGACRVPHSALGLRRTPEPQQLGQRTHDDLADGMLEVVAGPGEQLQRRRIEQGFGVDDVTYPLEPRRVDRACGGNADDDPDGGGATERHSDAHPGSQWRRPPRPRGR